MKKLIKADLYYMFSNRILTIGFIIFSIYSAVMPWFCNLRYKASNAAEYLSCLIPPSSTALYLRADILLIILTVIIGIMIRGIFKNGMINLQELTGGHRRSSVIALILASWIVVLAFFLPITFGVIGNYVLGGANDYEGTVVSFSYLIMLFAVLIIDMLHIQTNAVLFSYIFSSEVKGVCLEIGVELIKFYFLSMLFWRLSGNAQWIHYGLFPLMNCDSAASRAYWSRSNVPISFDLGLPFAGLLIDGAILVAILFVRNKVILSEK